MSSLTWAARLQMSLDHSQPTLKNSTTPEKSHATYTTTVNAKGAVWHGIHPSLWMKKQVCANRRYHCIGACCSRFCDDHTTSVGDVAYHRCVPCELGKDAAACIWQLRQRVFATGYDSLDLWNLDIHSLPDNTTFGSIMFGLLGPKSVRYWDDDMQQYEVDRVGKQIRHLTIRECNIRRIPYATLSGLYSIRLVNCPLFEGFDDLPPSCEIHIQVENCPLFFYCPVAYVPPGAPPSDARIFTSVYMFTILPHLNKWMYVWSRAREELVAEAFPV